MWLCDIATIISLAVFDGQEGRATGEHDFGLSEQERTGADRRVLKGQSGRFVCEHLFNLFPRCLSLSLLV